MPFAYNSVNQRITQTGTDADLSGLSTIAASDPDVVNIVVSGGRTLYTITGRFSIQGTLTADPLTEFLSVTSTVFPGLAIPSSGTMNIGSADQNSFKRSVFYSNTGLQVAGGTLNVHTASLGFVGTNDITVTNGGTLNANGSQFDGPTGNTIRMASIGSTLSLIDCELHNVQPESDTPDTLTITNLTQNGVAGLSFTVVGNANASGSFPVINYDGTNTTGVVTIAGGALVRLYDNAEGSELEVTASNVDTLTSIAEIYKTLNVSVLTDSFAAASGIVISIRDTVTGNPGTITTKGNDAVDYAQTIRYRAATVNGVLATDFTILTDTVTGANVHHRRTKYNNTSDIIDVSHYSYLHEFGTIESELKTAPRHISHIALVPDANVTNQNQTDVMAYDLRLEFFDTNDLLVTRRQTGTYLTPASSGAAGTGRLLIGYAPEFASNILAFSGTGIPGNNGFVELGPTTFGGEFSFCCWVRHGTFETWSRIIDFGNGTPGDNIILARSGGNTSYGAILFSGGTEILGFTAGSLLLNTWQHVALTLGSSGVDGTDRTLTLYIDGVQVGTDTASIISLPAVTRASSLIGDSQWTSDRGFVGNMGGFVLSTSQTFTPAEIQSLMAYTRTGIQDPLQVLTINDAESVATIADNTVVAAPIERVYDFAKLFVVDHNRDSTDDDDLDLLFTRSGSTLSTTMNITLDKLSLVGGISTTGTTRLLSGSSATESLRQGVGTATPTSTVRIQGLPSNSSAVAGAWPRSQGMTTRTGIITGAVVDTTNGTSIELTLNTEIEYFIIADAIGYKRSDPVLYNPATQSVVDVMLEPVTNGDGTGIIPTALTVNQQLIADTVVFNVTTNIIDITLPVGFATNSRWDTTNNIWTYPSTDFTAIAFSIEQGQSSEAALSFDRVIELFDTQVRIGRDNTIILRQAVGNADATINLNLIGISRDGDAEQKVTFVDYVNGPILIFSGSPVIARSTWSASEKNRVITAADETVVYARDTARNIQRLDDN